MGTFIGHFIPGLSFTILGLWHTFNTIKSYKLKGPSNFNSTAWFPFPRTKHLELYILLVFSIIVMVLQILDYPNFNLNFNPLNYEHATMFLHLGIYSMVALVVDLSSQSDAFSGFVTALGASVFGQELFLLHLHSADHVGLEGHYHFLLQLIVAMALLATIVTSFAPHSFLGALLRAVMILFQGLWFMVMGFVLWVPQLVPKGCHNVMVSEGSPNNFGAVGCGDYETSSRAMSLANLQFSWTLAGLVLFATFLCLRLDVRCCGSYKQLETKLGLDLGPVLGDQGYVVKEVHHALV